MRSACVSLVVASLAVAVPSPAGADEVLLKGGGRVVGVIVERTPEKVVVETGPGRVTLAASRVVAVRDGGAALNRFQERAETLAADDAAGWLELAQWAAEQGLNTQAQASFERVLALDSNNSVAHEALDHQFVAGRWLAGDEARRARGEVQYDGRWMTAAERDDLVRERNEARAEARNRAEIERVRLEADARVREAEARARAAEAQAREASSAYGFGLPGPYSYGVNGLVVGCAWPCTTSGPPYRPGYMPGNQPGNRPGHRPPQRPGPAPAPTATTLPTASWR
ncbi:MAG: hypothetical protein AB7O37_12310 [Vicinamibacteria bacterium]